MWSLLKLGEDYYKHDNKDKAFQYFDAVVGSLMTANTVDLPNRHEYISEIASYVGKKGDVRKSLQYHRAAIALGVEKKKYRKSWDALINSHDAEGNVNKMYNNGKYKKHVYIEIMYYHKKKGTTTWDGSYEYATYFDPTHFPKIDPEVKALCIECPREKLEIVLGKDRANEYIEYYQRELADKILAEEKDENNAMTREEIIEECSKSYHKDYLIDIEKIIEEQIEKNAKKIELDVSIIDIHGNKVLHDLTENTLSAMRGLLKELGSNAFNKMKDKKGKEGFGDREKAELKNLLLTNNETEVASKDKGEADYPAWLKLNGSIEEDAKRMSQYLQLQAFSEVAKALDITWEDPKPSAPVKEGFVAEPAYPAFDRGKEKDSTGAEVKNSLVNKLVKVAEVIDRVNQDIQKKAKKDNLNISTWSEFCTDALKSIGAVLSLVGIKLMYDSHQKFGTHKFWKGENEKQQIRTDKVKQKAANDARSSLFKTIGHHHERAKDEKKHHDVLEQQKKAHGRIRKS